MSLETLLASHRSSILSEDHEDRVRITIRRKFIFEDTLHKFRCGIDLSKHLRVTFVGEPAIDDGGPMREFLRLLLGAVISNNSLFSGDVDCRHLRHNIIELSKKTYFYVGQMLSMSLIHGGPMPSFFADPIADYIVHGIEKVNVGVTDVQDEMIRMKLQKVIHEQKYMHSRGLFA